MLEIYMQILLPYLKFLAPLLILKYHCRNYECRVLAQKFGYDRCPYLSFFVRRRWNLRLDGPKRLKYRVHHFLPKMLWNACEMLVMQLWMQDGKDDLTGRRNHNGIPKFVEERDPTPLGDNVVSLGTMIVYYRIVLQRYLNEDITF